MNDVALAPEPVESAPETAQPEEQSLADHEAAYTRLPNGQRPSEAPDGETATEREDRERDAQGRFRHRAQSQKASAEDVAEISALTKQLRDKERELAKVKPDALAGSPRVLSLKRQIAALEAELAPAKTPDPVAKPSGAPAASVATSTLRAKPTEDEIGTKYATYSDFVEDLAEWKAEQREAARDAKRSETQATEAYETLKAEHGQRIQAFRKDHADFDTVTAAIMNRPLPALLLASIVSDDNSAAQMYHLAQHPEVLDELKLLTEGREVNEDNVAIVQRRFKQHAQAATTGSAAVARPAFIPPKPPNPVRTGPIRTGDDLPGDESSLAEHERAFGPRRRR